MHYLLAALILYCYIILANIDVELCTIIKINDFIWGRAVCITKVRGISKLILARLMS